jgi:restriction system protein
MANLTRRRGGEILQGVFEVLLEAPNGLEVRKVIADVERKLELTEFEQATYPKHPDVRRFPKIVRFTTINAVKAGWLVKEDGIWSLTDAGTAALREFQDPEDLMREAVRLYNEWHRDQSDLTAPASTDTGDADAKLTDDEPGARLTLEEAQETAFTEIRDYLQAMDPYDFQELVAALLRGMDYHVVWVSPRGRDGGLDILAQSDPLGTEGPRIKGQVKRRKDKATADEMRSFISLVGSHDVGVFISLGGFTSEAESIARTQETRRVTTIGLSTLLKLWTEHQPQLDEADRSLLPLTPVYYLTPSD